MCVCGVCVVCVVWCGVCVVWCMCVFVWYVCLVWCMCVCGVCVCLCVCVVCVCGVVYACLVWCMCMCVCPCLCGDNREEPENNRSYTGSDLVRDTGYPKVSRGFPHSLHLNTSKLPESGHGRFLQIFSTVSCIPTAFIIFTRRQILGRSNQSGSDARGIWP